MSDIDDRVQEPACHVLRTFGNWRVLEGQYKEEARIALEHVGTDYDFYLPKGPDFREGFSWLRQLWSKTWMTDADRADLGRALLLWLTIVGAEY